MQRYAVLAVLAGVLAAAPALADPQTTLSATYDAFLQNTVFSILNNSASEETSVELLTNFGPTTTVHLDDLDPGELFQYSFNQPNGGFIVDPQNAGLLDTTQYELQFVLNGVTVNSGWFSTINNLTGGYVDFLGNTCYGQPGCNGQNVVESGIVAAVPAPAMPGLLAAGVVGLAMLRRRRAAA